MSRATTTKRNYVGHICEMCGDGFVYNKETSPYYRVHPRRFCSRTCSAKSWRYPQPVHVKSLPTTTVAGIDIAWAAGLYEGEGSCSRTWRMQIVQKDTWVLERCRSLFGGAIYQRVGKDTRFDDPRIWVCHVWVLNGAMARGFAMTIYKFLSPRRRQQINQWFGLESANVN